ncbi:hypothetical protein HPB50_003671 [Hyalomma asiaticum]|uniref:Uncharacterized protein n=1 Tax=Hyalomma asiaticum TaxID=266040 RepID=A0ACB7TBK4_HYAAI|nr:hypothetical protein HPB50_003671 [Hyalomma asiaticum]
MSRRMLKHRYPTGKATETAQPVAPLPQPAADVMPQWDGSASFQSSQYPSAVLDPQHQQQQQLQSNSQESAAVAGGDGMMSASMQPWNSGSWSTPQPNMTLTGPQSWTGGGGAQPPDPTGVGGSANLHEAAVAPVTT